MSNSPQPLPEPYFVAQGLATWITHDLNGSVDFARQGLPPCDIQAFVTALARSATFLAEPFSLAMVGFGVDEAALRLASDRAGLVNLRGWAVDLHTATVWRNGRDEHPRVIALARGYNPSVHGLNHMRSASSSSLAVHLLAWARGQDAFTGTPEHRNLIDQIQTGPGLEGLRSLDGVARFLSAWTRSTAPRIDAPRDALPSLGLLGDPGLFETDHLGARLEANLGLRARVTMLPPAELRVRRRRARNYVSPERRATMMGVLDRLDAFRRDSRSPFTLQDAQSVIKPLADGNVDADPEPEQDEGTTHDVGARTDAIVESADALLEGNEADLEAIGAALDEAWQDFEDGHLSATAATSKGSVPIEIDVKQELLSWVSAFCTAERFGGYLETNIPDLAQALARHADENPIFIDANKVWTHEGETYSIERLLAGWDGNADVRAASAKSFVSIWAEFIRYRAEVARYINPLLVHPREWLDTHPEARTSCENYIRAAGELFEGLRRHYHAVRDRSQEWAQATLDALLTFDLVQVSIKGESGRIAKAVMLPLHPLHLWRYVRLGTILKGFAKGKPLPPGDKEALLADLSRPEHFLSVIKAGVTPEGRGLNRLLPLAKDIDNLATFENLLNAVSSADGVDGLLLALERYVLLHPNHARPLRLGLVNPPEPGKLLTTIIKLLDDKFFTRARLPALEISIFATKGHADRLAAAAALQGGAQDLVYEKVAAGRLGLRVDPRKWENLDDLISVGFDRTSFHILAIFDETSITIRRRRVDRLYPMSPFCIRNIIDVDEMFGKVSLVPHPGEPPFSDFVSLINEIEREQTDSAMFASAEATKLRAAVDGLLYAPSPKARWVFLADRALPEESGMRAVRLLQRREGQRQVLLCSADHGRLANAMRSAFARCNLSVTSDLLERVLVQGVNLVGAGLLDMIRKADGEADANKVLGFVGMLLAARSMHAANPDTLVASVDGRIARLWLRLGDRSASRCDLISVMRNPDGSFDVVCVEVKTTGGSEFTKLAELEAEAAAQIESTASVVHSALFASDEDVFAPPRLEMLKEVLVRSVSTRWTTEKQDSERRRVWGPWLRSLFDDPAKRPNIRIKGEIILVKLRSNKTETSRSMLGRSLPIEVRTITELLAETLLSDVGTSQTPAGPGTPVNQGTPPDAASPVPSSVPPAFKIEVISPLPVSEIEVDVASVETRNSAEPGNVDEQYGDAHAVPVEVRHTDGPPLTERPVKVQPPALAAQAMVRGSWPPTPNKVGLIGQVEAVRELSDLAQKSVGWGDRFPDKLLVGPAGVGKTTLARRIAELFLNVTPILFNGADLKRPSMIIDRLISDGKVPNDPAGTIDVDPCLIFIDEVHAISSNVMTALLSVLDDGRTTSIDNVLYRFNRVIFLLATTDPGHLSEAFLSRPTRTLLRPYSLEEMAGIVWMHARERLGADLSRDVCIEISARMQCSPRPTVRILEPLEASIYARLAEGLDRSPTKAEVAAGMDFDTVSSWFDDKGIDQNGLSGQHRKVLDVLSDRGSASEDDLKRTLGITNRGDFIELTEFLTRLGLMQVNTGGRSLTREGRRYAKHGAFDLRSRISRHSG